MVHSTAPTVAAVHCPRGVLAVVPPRAPNWIFIRPRAIYDHPRLGPIVSRSFDAAGERALIERTERYGYDARTFDRAVIAWTPHNTLYVAAGPVDHARVVARFWDRLIAPRRRTHDALSDERLEGVLGEGTSAALLTAPGCGMIAYEEGPATRIVDRLIAPPPPGASPADPDDVLLLWHSRQVPAELVAATHDDALARFVREIELRAGVSDAGVAVRLLLRGALPSDATERIHRALAAIATSALGELAGASSWLGSTSVASIAPPDEGLVLTVTIPWPALRALADALRGDVGAPGVD